jgi:trans-aconitate 2-methyltransferase
VGTEWDASVYQRVSGPQLAWGRSVLARIDLRGDETVLDAGCGTGRVTRLLAERLPRGRVVAVDGSAAMVEEARAQLADLGDRVQVVQGDLLELAPPQPVDVVVSTATFHWILDHERLFRAIAGALAPGGRLVAQCGGAGNIARVLGVADALGEEEPYAAALRGMPPSWLFAGPDETVARLEASGLTDARAWLETADTPMPSAAEAESFLRTVVLRHHVERLPPALAGPYVREVVRRLQEPDGTITLDYVRLNLEARRPPVPRPTRPASVA